MPFSWYRPDVPSSYLSASGKTKSMYEREMAERAALLLRLGYSKADAVSRVRGNVRWDFELHADPAHLESVNKIVERVYSRRGVGAGPPTL